MIRALAAGAAYALALLAVGTILGTLRVLALAPRLGTGWAVAIELPLMLAFAWTVTGPILRRARVPSGAPRLVMSVTALAFLLAGEAALAALLTDAGPRAWLQGLRAPAAWPGLAAQAAAALMPLMRAALP